MLTRLGLPRLVVVPLRELERHDPRAAGGEAGRGRRSSTAGRPRRPSVSTCSNANPSSTEITYLDADLMFFSDPEALFDEMGRTRR